jgi:DDE superfamily endonuclease
VELAAFARAVGASPTKQIVLVLDQAGWRTSVHLRVPEHVHLLFLPPYSPELQPAEHLWSLTNDALVNAHCATWTLWMRPSSLAAPSCKTSPTVSALPRCSPGGPDALGSAKDPGGTDINPGIKWFWPY